MEDEIRVNKALIEQFYTSFARRDYAGMIACYSPQVEFSDPIFQLKGKAAWAMWNMLCESGKDLAITFKDVAANENSGKAHWEASYTFSATGRRVHNILDAEFQFENGKIMRHHDQFNFWRWASQALGPAGIFLGWTPMIQNRVKETARNNLNKFIAKHPEYRQG
jgi:ketosteroid isomerase-like protein